MAGVKSLKVKDTEEIKAVMTALKSDVAAMTEVIDKYLADTQDIQNIGSNLEKLKEFHKEIQKLVKEVNDVVDTAEVDTNQMISVMDDLNNNAQTIPTMD